MRVGLVSLAIGLLAAGAPAYGADNLTGDKTRGESQVAACAACHGSDGATGIDPTYPNLAGQNERYLLGQLQKIQSGARNVVLMTGQLNAKSEQDLADIAAYYASLPGKLGQSAAPEESVALAARIYRGGDLRKGIAACAACHSPSAAGNAPAGFPRLSGQPPAYTIAQLTAYREGLRDTDEDYGGMMRDIASGLTDTEIAALADYLSGLH